MHALENRNSKEKQDITREDCKDVSGPLEEPCFSQQA